MRPFYLRHAVIAPASRLLVSLSGKQQMDSHQAHVMLVSIALQESNATHRWQVRGPARGYWQFEKAGGTAGVMRHRSTGQWAESLVTELDLVPSLDAVWEALPYSELLQAGFARLLLYTHPDPLPLPMPENEERAWDQYRECWRPGKPHRERWGDNWALALELCGDF